MSNSKPRISRCVRWSLKLSLTVTLMGGSLFSSCQGRVWDATVQGTKDYFLSLLDPGVVIGGFMNGDNESSVSSD